MAEKAGAECGMFDDGVAMRANALVSVLSLCVTVFLLTFQTLVTVDTLQVIETTTVQVCMLFMYAREHRRPRSLFVEADEGFDFALAENEK